MVQRLSMPTRRALAEHAVNGVGDGTGVDAGAGACDSACSGTGAS